MANLTVITINVFGVLVSLFSIYVTVRIYQKYKLSSSIFFIITAASISVWNILHLLFNFIQADSFQFGFIRFLWLILVYSGITFFFTFVFGYSNLRYESINWRLLLYTALATAFSVLFVTQTDWVNVSYNPSEGWVTTVFYQPFWTVFSFAILLLGFIEIIIPLVNTYSRSELNKKPVSIMLIAVLFAIFSNGLEPILTILELPQAIRFLIADIGFLLFFLVLLQHPFTGLYDTAFIHQVIVADHDGIPILSLSRDSAHAILTSGAMIGINSILEEITNEQIPIKSRKAEITRKIELGTQQFYIIIKEAHIVLYQFENPSGVCYSKFVSLARVFNEESSSVLEEKEMIGIFQWRLKEYYQSFSLQMENDERIIAFGSQDQSS